jgi:hypothetical protein
VTRSPWYPAEGDWLSGRAPRSHRGGHWFDPSIAHPARRPVPSNGPAVFDLPAAAECSSRAGCQLPSHWPSLRSASRVAAEGTSVKISSDGDLAVPQDLHGYAVPRSQPQVRPHAWYIRPGREHPCTRPGLQAGSPATLTGWLRAWLFIRVAEHLLGRRCGKVNPDAEIPVLSVPPTMLVRPSRRASLSAVLCSRTLRTVWSSASQTSRVSRSLPWASRCARNLARDGHMRPNRPILETESATFRPSKGKGRSGKRHAK